MNQTLSDSYIQRIYNLDLKTIKDLYDQVLESTDNTIRQNEQTGVYNRSRLKAASAEIPLGNEADGIPILIAVDPKTGVLNSKLNLKSHTDYVKLIAQNKAGYLSSVEITGENQKAIDDFNLNNGMKAMFNTTVKQGAMWGVNAFRLYNTVDQGVKTTAVKPWEYTPFYNEVGELAFTFQTKKISDSVKEYYNNSTARVTILTPTEELHFYVDNDTMVMNNVDYPTIVEDNITKEAGVRKHFFNGVPFVEFFNNDEKRGDVEYSLLEQDTIDRLMSKADCGFGTFADHILTDTTAEGENINQDELDSMAKGMEKYGVLLHGKWAWLSKKYEGYEALFKHLQLKESIVFQNSNSYNPNSLGGDGTAPTKYQIEQKMKLLSDSTVETENQYDRSLRELYRLALTHGSRATGTTVKPLNLTIAFQHTIPEDKVGSLKIASDGGANVPQKLWFDELGYKYEEVEVLQDEESKKVNNEFE